MRKTVKKNNVIPMKMKEINGFKIEKHIPMPLKESFRRHKWDFSSMSKGDSFFVEIGSDKKKAIQKSNNFVSSFRQSQRNGSHKGVFIDVRVLAEKGKWGFRVWRVA